VKEITGGKLCEVVYDGVGKETFPASLDCIKPLGMFVSFGSASGPVDAFNINILQTKGSLFATRPTLNTYVAKREDLVETANDLFDVVASGAVKIPVNQKYPLKDAQKAHRDLESRGTTGSTILLPCVRPRHPCPRAHGLLRHLCSPQQVPRRGPTSMPATRMWLRSHTSTA